MIPSVTAVMPPVTFCLSPGYKETEVDSVGLSRLRPHCEATNRTDFKGCVDDLTFRLEDVLVDAVSLAEGSLNGPESFSSPASFNVLAGSCFTFRHPEPRRLTVARLDMLLFRMTGTHLERGWNIITYFHSPGMFMPVLGISPQYAGQKFAISKSVFPHQASRTFPTGLFNLRA